MLRCAPRVARSIVLQTGGPARGCATVSAALSGTRLGELVRTAGQTRPSSRKVCASGTVARIGGAKLQRTMPDKAKAGRRAWPPIEGGRGRAVGSAKGWAPGRAGGVLEIRLSCPPGHFRSHFHSGQDLSSLHARLAATSTAPPARAKHISSNCRARNTSRRPGCPPRHTQLRWNKREDTIAPGQGGPDDRHKPWERRRRRARRRQWVVAGHGIVAGDRSVAGRRAVAGDWVAAGDESIKAMGSMQAM